MPEPTSIEEREESLEAVKARLERNEFFSAGLDPRFPNQNQAKRCWVNYVDYHRCRKQKGDDYEPCYFFRKVFRNICPHAWVSKWDEQMDAGTFPYDFEKDLKEKQGGNSGASHGKH